MSYVLPLDGCEPHLAEVVGGKAVGLGLLLREGLHVPPGFALGTHAYREFVRETGIAERLRPLLAGGDSISAQAAASDRVGRLFAERELPGSLHEEVAAAYARLGRPPVAVRSSAVSEDAAQASFAGEHETFLWQQGEEAVARSILGCWASLFTSQALAYFRRVGLVADETAMGVVVQTMVAAEAAGVMMTIDPVTGDRSQIVIEGSFGLGEAVVAGEVTPDRYAVDKVTLEIRSRVLSTKHVAYRFDPGLGEVHPRDVPPGEQDLPCLADDEVIALAALGKRLERALGCPQDVEWAFGPGVSGERELFLLQARPETVWSAAAAPRP